jgi:hypothetical protein
VLITMIPIDNALAVASKNLNTDHRPDFTNTEPAANIGPFPQWSDPKKIVAMDPLGKCCDGIGDSQRDFDPVFVKAPTQSISSGTSQQINMLT